MRSLTSHSLNPHREVYWSRVAHPWTRWNPLNGLICYPKEEHLEQREQILPDVHRSGMIIALLLTSRRPGVFASVDKEPVFLSSSRCSMRSHIRSEESASCATGDARARAGAYSSCCHLSLPPFLPVLSRSFPLSLPPRCFIKIPSLLSRSLVCRVRSITLRFCLSVVRLELLSLVFLRGRSR